MASKYDGEIRRLQKNARAKIRRIKANNGVDITGTTDNPIESTKGMTARQKAAYANRLRRFNSRETRFVHDTYGERIPTRVWDRYKAAERAANAMIKADMKKYRHVKAMDSDASVQESQIFRAIPKKMMINPSGSAFHVHERQPNRISAKSLDKFTKAQLAKLRPDYIAKRVKMGREQAREMIDAINDPEMQRAVDALTNEQFHVLWNYSDFANSLSLGYSAVKSRMTRPKMVNEGIIESSLGRSHALIEWARQV